MKRAFWIAIFIFLATIIGYIVYLAANFELFPAEERLIEEFSTARGERYVVFYIPGNATTQEVLQLRKALDEEQYRVVQNFERFDKMESYFLLNDTTLQLVLRSDVRGSKDTAIVKL